jgi:O-antigen/teichoic acid export membrane protein
LVNIVSGPLGSVLLMTGEERWSARISVASLGLLGLLCVTIIPLWGLNGAAITTSLLILFRTGTQSIIVRKKFAAG